MMGGNELQIGVKSMEFGELGRGKERGDGG